MEINNKFLISVIIFVGIVAVLGLFYPDNSIETRQHPTQDEWLEIYTSNNIREVTDLWKQRTLVNVYVNSEDENGRSLLNKEMIIKITSANGQTPLTEAAKSQYAQTAENIAKSILESYNLTNYKLTVQYID